MVDEPAEAENGSVALAEIETTTETDDGIDSDAPDTKPARSHVLLALIVGVMVVVAVGGLAAWLGYRDYELRRDEQLRNLLISVGRQGAINLTTIDAAEAEKDVQRILDLAADEFYDDFSKRSQPFIEVVKQAQSKSVGTITEAGLESMSENEGHVLVAVTVHTTNRGAPEQQPRSWRMRLTVKQTGKEEAKISKVEFVP